MRVFAEVWGIALLVILFLHYRSFNRQNKIARKILREAAERAQQRQKEQERFHMAVSDPHSHLAPHPFRKA